MKYLVLSVLAVIVAGTATAQNAPRSKISSALGMKLGKTYKVEEGAVLQRELDGSELYPFKPPKRREPFTEYLVEVTPKTKKISQIWAGAMFKDLAPAREARDKLLAALEKKYGTRADADDRYAKIAAMQDGYVIKSGNRMIMLIIMEKDGQYRLLLKYIDRILKDTAKQERIDLAREENEGGDMGQAL